MGRSRGGLTTKIHALVDANGMPIRLKLTEGQAHDGKSAADLIATLATGQILLADRAYDSDALRESLAARGAWANVKPISRRRTEPRRALLQQAQTLPRHRDALRKARRQLPRPPQTRISQNLDALYESVT